MNRINFYITLYIIIKVYVGMNDVLHRLVSKLCTHFARDLLGCFCHVIYNVT